MPLVRASLFMARIGITMLLMLIALFALFPYLLKSYGAGAGNFAISLLMLATGLAAILFARSRLRRFLEPEALGRWFEQAAEPLYQWADGASAVTLRWAIVIMAGLTLFLELMLIRWQAGLFIVFALYKNFTLLSCFCGLGIGYALARERPLLLAFCLPMLAMTLFLLIVLRYTSDHATLDFLYVIQVGESSVPHSGMGDSSLMSRVLTSIPICCLLIGTFALNALTMLPAGQFCGWLMEREKTLVAYGSNLLGSILGVTVLFAFSWLWIGPVIWFGLSVALVLWYQLPSPKARQVGLISAALCMVLVGWPVEPLVQNIYSPYQLIQKAAKPNGLMEILASGAYYQKAYDLTPGRDRDTKPGLRKAVGYYDLPFRTASTLAHVAIVGAGCGNDASAALRNGAALVDAVEIDPAITALGKQNHPEHPYLDSRVHVVVNDARTFFRNSTDTYDAIVYSVLDSHVLLSHGSNVRVDSFVYTMEGFREAYAHLKPGGLMSVAFAQSSTLMGEKVYRMLSLLEGGGKPVAILTGYDALDTATFMIRKNAEVAEPHDFMAKYNLSDVTDKYAASSGRTIELPTDNWPFFYLDAKMYPASYLCLLVLILILSFVMVRRFFPTARWQPSQLPFFFLGGGFMLVETKAITELGLIFGNTWQVVGITIISVLIMAYCANLLVTRLYSTRLLVPAYVLLIAVIALGYSVASAGGIGHIDAFSRLIMLVLLTSPLLFSGIVFSTLLKTSGTIGDAMAYNLMGAMLGGVLEYSSMLCGFAFLYLMALVLYGLAWSTTRYTLARK